MLGRRRHAEDPLERENLELRRQINRLQEELHQQRTRGSPPSAAVAGVSFKGRPSEEQDLILALRSEFAQAELRMEALQEELRKPSKAERIVAAAELLAGPPPSMQQLARGFEDLQRLLTPQGFMGLTGPLPAERPRPPARQPSSRNEAESQPSPRQRASLTTGQSSSSTAPAGCSAGQSSSSAAPAAPQPAAPQPAAPQPAARRTVSWNSEAEVVTIPPGRDRAQTMPQAPAPARQEERETTANAVRRLRAQMGAAPKVCILGSTTFLDPQSETMAEQLGKCLSEWAGDDVVLITAGATGVQEAMTRGCSAKCHLFHLMEVGKASNFPRGRDVYAGKSAQEKKDVLGAIGDFYITIEGGPSVSQLCQAAVSRGAVVIPIGRSGGASAGKLDFPQVALQIPSFADAVEWNALGSREVPVETTVSAALALLSRAVGKELPTARGSQAVNIVGRAADTRALTGNLSWDEDGDLVNLPRVGKAITTPSRNSDESLHEPEQLLVRKVHSMVRWNKPYQNIQSVVVEDGITMRSVVNAHDDKNGNQCLHLAAQSGLVEMCRLLLQDRADPNGTNGKGNTALHMSVEYDFHFQSAFLISAHADLNARNEDGHTALTGLGGTKVGAEAWNAPLTILKAASDNADELNKAFSALERANPATLDKAAVVQVGMAKKKVCTQHWNADRFRDLMNRLP